MKIGITGADGFIGQHVRFALLPLEKCGKIKVHDIPKAAFLEPAMLEASVDGCDAIIHLAGLNRGSEEEVYRINVELARSLIHAVKATSCIPHIIFVSSIHRSRDSAYGRAKLHTQQEFEAWSQQVGGAYTTVVLPHVFGEFAKPHYNSAVATFCSDLAQGIKSDVHDGEVELLYVGDAARVLIDAIETGTTGDIVVTGEKMSVQNVYAILAHFHAAYSAGIMPPMKSALEHRLFLTLQSYMFTTLFPLTLQLHSDARGVLAEIVRSFSPDQFFFSISKPGVVRGNHYHTRKFERFCVLSGQAAITTRKLLSNHAQRFVVSGDNPVVIDMPTYHTHSIENIGSADMLAVFWISEHYNEKDSDTYPEPV